MALPLLWLDVPGLLRVPVVVVAVVLLPGSVLVRPLGLDDAWTRAALVPVTGLAVVAVLSALASITGLWYPQATATALVVGSTLLLCRGRGTVPVPVPVGAAA